jgi:hypothetical protein
VLLAACGGDDDDTQSRSTTTAMGGDGSTPPSADTSLVAAVVSSDLYVSDDSQRFAFILREQDGAFASTGDAVITMKAPNGSVSQPTAATLHSQGLPEKRGIYVVQAQFAQAGVYDATVTANDEEIPLPFQVAAASKAPPVGAVAPAAASPTTTDTMDVDPLCTREPVCPLHDRSLDDLVGKGRPVAVMFATPALCQTAYCGPVLDTLLPFRDQYPNVDFVHVEIYKDTTATDVVPAVTEWGLPGEPWLFGIDAQGRVAGRLDGAFATDEIDALLTQLA